MLPDKFWVTKTGTEEDVSEINLSAPSSMNFSEDSREFKTKLLFRGVPTAEKRVIVKSKFAITWNIMVSS